MKGRETKNLRIILVIVFALIIVAAEAGVLVKMVGMVLRKETPRQVQEGRTGPLELSGEWVQTNSESADSYQAISITDQTIDIYWISESDRSYMLYWSGTYKAPTVWSDTYHWISYNDTDRTSTSRRGSAEAEKEFIYTDGKLTYQVEPMESGKQRQTVEAEHRSWGYTPVHTPQEDTGEQFQQTGDLGAFHIEIGGAEVVEDADGNPAVIVTYRWTNNSEASASASVMLLERAYQGKTELEPAQLRTGYDAGLASQAVSPGGTATVQRAYCLENEKPLTFMVTEFLNRTNAVVREYALPEEPE